MTLKQASNVLCWFLYVSKGITQSIAPKKKFKILNSSCIESFGAMVVCTIIIQKKNLEQLIRPTYIGSHFFDHEQGQHTTASASEIV